MLIRGGRVLKVVRCHGKKLLFQKNAGKAKVAGV